MKFKLRYLVNLKWDRYPDDKIIKRLEKGNNFHLLARRYFMGIDMGLQDNVEEFEELQAWMEILRKSFPMKPEKVYLPEHRLRMISGSLRLEANFDLLIINGSTIEIWDWKTHGEDLIKGRRPAGRMFSESLQTAVYMFVLYELSNLVINKSIEYENVSMHYWQPEPCGVIESIRYSRKLHDKYKAMLEEKLDRVINYDFEEFDRLQYQKHCRFCEFNWYCNKGKVSFESLEEDSVFTAEP